jgi:hypothetical protein
MYTFLWTYLQAGMWTSIQIGLWFCSLVRSWFCRHSLELLEIEEQGISDNLVIFHFLFGGMELYLFNPFRDIFPAACCALMILLPPIPRSLLRGIGQQGSRPETRSKLRGMHPESDS